jgi:hypothetical protein
MTHRHRKTLTYSHRQVRKTVVDGVSSISVLCHGSSISEDLGSRNELPPLERGTAFQIRLT